MMEVFQLDGAFSEWKCQKTDQIRKLVEKLNLGNNQSSSMEQELAVEW
jgi:hypothetical protein